MKALFAILMFLPASASACFSLAHPIIVSGSSFSDTSLSFNANCGFSLFNSSGGDSSVPLRIRKGQACFSDDGLNCNATTSAPLKNDSVTSGTIEINKNVAYIFSVDASGSKDINKPYLKITPTKAQSAVVEMIEKGKPVGRLTVNGEICTRSFSPKGSALDLRGKEYTPGGAGCTADYMPADFVAGSAVAPAAAHSSAP